MSVGRSIDMQAAGKRIYIDMDGVMVDFQSGVDRIPDAIRQRYAQEGRLTSIPGLYALMDPMPGAIDAFHQLSQENDVFLLSTPPWYNPAGWSEKVSWVHDHLGHRSGTPAYKRLILSHRKDLLRGDYIIDDRMKNGVGRFEGEHIHFGTGRFPDWGAVLEYLLPRRLTGDAATAAAA